MGNFVTEQEAFWAGSFGDQYIDRNQSLGLLAANISFFSELLKWTGPINSVLEIGANVGMNLKALRALLPLAELTGLEINAQAIAELSKACDIAHHGSILDFRVDYQRDMTLSKGVLIHINPDHLDSAYDRLYSGSKRFICIAEYYNPVPVELSYRGHEGRLFKRDFAGEMLNKYPDLSLVSCGFLYRRDPLFPQDDINWFLLKK